MMYSTVWCHNLFFQYIFIKIWIIFQFEPILQYYQGYLFGKHIKAALCDVHIFSFNSYFSFSKRFHRKTLKVVY